MADHDDILSLAEARFRECYTADAPERELIDKDVRFAINEDESQWPDDVKMSREEDDPPRPCPVVNKIPEKIDQIEGEFRKLSPSYKIRAVDSFADPVTADILAGMVRQIEYDSQAQTAYNTSHTNTLYGGRGAWRIDVEDDDGDPFVRKLVVNRIPNVQTVSWDQFTKKTDKSDADYFFVTELIPTEEYKAEYGEPVSEWPIANQWVDWKNPDGSAYRVAEYWYKDKKEVTYVRVDRGNGPETILESERHKSEEILKNKAGEELRKTGTKTEVKWCKLVAGKILDGPNDWPSQYIPIIIQSGKEVWVRGKAKTRGMVRFGKTPQQLLNYCTASIYETLQASPKSPYLITAKMLGPYKGMWDVANKKNFPYLAYEVDPNDPTRRVERLAPAQVNPALFQEVQNQEHNIMGAMGVYQSKLGDQGDEKSGRAILARQAQGDTGAYVFTDNFVSALIHSTRILIDLIPHVYDTQRIVRILGEDGRELSVPINAAPNGPVAQQAAGQMQAADPNAKYYQMREQAVNNLLNDLSVGKYDVRVTVGPAYATQRQESVAQLIELAGQAPPIVPALLVGIVENLDIPEKEKILARVKSTLPENLGGSMKQGPPPPNPELIKVMQDFQLEMRRQDREEFDSRMKAIKIEADAAAKTGMVDVNKFAEMADHIKEMLDHHRESKQMEMQQQQAQQQPQGAPGGKQ